VLEQYFQAEGNEHKPADNFYAGFKKVPEFAANPYAKVREDKGNQAYDYHSRHYGSNQKRKRYPNSEGVDTRSERQGQQDKNVLRIKVTASRPEFE
jgi:hypothetical protein